MGPLLALTFGSLVNDAALLSLGLRNGTLSLVLVTGIGFLLGLSMAVVGVGRDDQHWPSEEMQQRGRADGLLIGLAIAIPSGEQWRESWLWTHTVRGRQYGCIYVMTM